MSFYLRKSKSIGPFRINFSKSGIGVSTGIKGLRIGTGPRGNYVHMGRKGIYYRQSLTAITSKQPANIEHIRNQLERTEIQNELQEIESASIDRLVDKSAQDLIEEINTKVNSTRIFPYIMLFGIIGAAIIVFALNSILWLLIPWLLITIIATVLIYYRDELNRTVVIQYKLEPDIETAYQNLHQAYSELNNCDRIWHIPASGDIRDTKYHGGASTIVKRNLINNKNQSGILPISFIRSNIQFPILLAGKQKLVFMPERILVLEDAKAGAVSYADLSISISSVRFVEESALPNDAQVVDHTWRYVNKKGGPDRRFKDNPKLPIALYEEIYLQSESGLNELFQVSRTGTGDPFKDSIQRLASLIEI